MALVRGCGKRTQGGIYLESRLCDEGLPLEHFLIDSPIPVPAELRLNPQGQRLVAIEGNDYVLDWVGESGYPNVADFIEEVRHFGADRKVSPSLVGQIPKGSYFLFAHPRARVENFRDVPYWSCPKRFEHHLSAHAEEPCLGVVWQDIEGGERIATGHTSEMPLPGPGAGQIYADEGLVVQRTMPAFTYYGRCRPEGLVPQYTTAFFLRLPITNIAVIADSEGDHWDTVERIRDEQGANGIPVLVEEE